MGLNYVKRSPREELDPPNDFVTIALGEQDIDFKEHGEELAIDFENRILDKVHKDLENLEF